MAYVIIILIAAVALFLIFRDDHDDSYTKEKEPKRTYRPESSAQPVRRVQQAVPQNPPTVSPTAGVRPLFTAMDFSFLDRVRFYSALPRTSMDTYITGLRYRCTQSDLGLVMGTVTPEPNNPRDPRAQVVCRNDGKVLGYIPRADLDRYNFFNDGNRVCLFAGKIESSVTGTPHADIRVFLPTDRSYVENEIRAYLASVRIK